MDIYRDGVPVPGKAMAFNGARSTGIVVTAQGVEVLIYADELNILATRANLFKLAVPVDPEGRFIVKTDKQETIDVDRYDDPYAYEYWPESHECDATVCPDCGTTL